jgi:hypothetical protein
LLPPSVFWLYKNGVFTVSVSVKHILLSAAIQRIFAGRFTFSIPHIFLLCRRLNR